jgi:hypothetical protein
MKTHLINYTGFLNFMIGVSFLYLMRRIRPLNRLFQLVQVFEHECTHVLVSKLFGGRFIAMKLSATGGVAYTTRDNILIRLSPYFFPVFSIAVLLSAQLLNPAYKDLGLIASGFFYGNFAANAFSQMWSQTDIRRSGGRFLAYSIIVPFHTLIVLTVGLLIKKLF